MGRKRSADGMKVFLVYALGLAVTLIIEWFRDPHSLF